MLFQRRCFKKNKFFLLGKNFLFEYQNFIGKIVFKMYYGAIHVPSQRFLLGHVFYLFECLKK